MRWNRTMVGTMNNNQGVIAPTFWAIIIGKVPLTKSHSWAGSSCDVGVEDGGRDDECACTFGEVAVKMDVWVEFWREGAAAHDGSRDNCPQARCGVRSGAL